MKDTNGKTAFIIGRFQIHDIEQHLGYVSLLNYAVEKYDAVVVLVGSAYRKCTQTDPLPVRMRRDMIDDFLYNSLSEGQYHDVLALIDHKDDKEWSKRLDVVLESASHTEKFDILVGRDSFKSHYSGKYRDNIVELNFEIDGICSSDIRKTITYTDYTGESLKKFAEGVIWASRQPFPRVDMTVDIALVKRPCHGNVFEILLGRKPDEKLWRLPGGFVDPTDNSLENAAKRELKEETNLNINIEHFNYICTKNISDWRYRKGVDSSLTALFLVELDMCEQGVDYLVASAKASDDLAEIKYMPLNKELLSSIESEHVVLLEIILNNYEINY